MQSLSFQMSGIDGCLATHEHQDHIKAAKEVMKAGVDLYCSKGTAEAVGLTGHRLHHIKAKQQFKIQNWTILPFDTVHDCAEPLAFLIQSGTDKLLFMTDSSFCKYQFSGITHAMLECNFSDKILEENIKSGRVSQARKKRLVESHFSLERLIEMLKKNDLSKLVSVTLIHLSRENSDAEEFKKKIQSIVGVPTYIAGE